MAPRHRAVVDQDVGARPAPDDVVAGAQRDPPARLGPAGEHELDDGVGRAVPVGLGPAVQDEPVTVAQVGAVEPVVPGEPGARAGVVGGDGVGGRRADVPREDREQIGGEDRAVALDEDVRGGSALGLHGETHPHGAYFTV